MKPHWWTTVDWTGASAFVLAVGVAVSLVVGFIGAIQYETISPQGAELLSTLGGAVVGAVATYLGVGRREQMRRSDHRSEDEPERIKATDRRE